MASSFVSRAAAHAVFCGGYGLGSLATQAAVTTKKLRGVARTNCTRCYVQYNILILPELSASFGTYRIKKLSISVFGALTALLP